MPSKTYSSNKLISILDSLLSKNSSGVLSLTTMDKSLPAQRSCILILRNGSFAGTNKYITKPFEPEELRQIVGQYINK